MLYGIIFVISTGGFCWGGGGGGKNLIYDFWFALYEFINLNVWKKNTS